MNVITYIVEVIQNNPFIILFVFVIGIVSGVIQIWPGSRRFIFGPFLWLYSLFRRFCSFRNAPRRIRVAAMFIFLVCMIMLVAYLLRPSIKQVDIVQGLAGPSEPVPPLDYPKMSVVSDLPAESVIRKESPNVTAEEAELWYRNETDVDLVLFMLDCSQYYDGVEEPWATIPMAPGEIKPPWTWFDKKSHGWYSFVIRDQRTGKDTLIESRPIFNKKTTGLTVVQAEPAIKVKFD